MNLKILKQKEQGESKIIQYDQYFPITVKTSSTLTRRNIIKSDGNQYKELTDPEYQKETFIVTKSIDGINVEEFIMLYENDSDGEADVEATITQNSTSEII
jgi:ABC-type Fe3+ transport system substrate-binding protein